MLSLFVEIILDMGYWGWIKVDYYKFYKELIILYFNCWKLYLIFFLFFYIIILDYILVMIFKSYFFCMCYF